MEKSEDAVPVFVWIGGDYEGVQDPEDETVCGLMQRLCECLLQVLSVRMIVHA